MGEKALADAGVPDPGTDTMALLGEVTRRQTLPLRLAAQESLTPEQEERFRSLLLLRTRREPLQYLLGRQCFYGLEFRVDARVLIPRQETEMLCELAIQALSGRPGLRAADVCTGSGAIAVTMKHFCENAEVTATDISPEALSVARENARRNGVEVRFLEGDLLLPLAGERFDAIVCNPPYVDREACEALQPEVRREPLLALLGGEDGLDFYRRLAKDAPDCLVSGGSLLLEVGDGQARRVSAMLEDTGLFEDTAIRRDLYGAERFVTARRAAWPT